MKKIMLVCIIFTTLISVVYAGEMFFSDGKFSFEWMGEKVAVKDAYGNDCSLIFYNDTAYVPVRTIGKLVNEDVGFDAENKVVSIGTDVDTLNIASIEIEYYVFANLSKKVTYDFQKNIHTVIVSGYEGDVWERNYLMPKDNQAKFFEALKKTEFFNWEDSYECEEGVAYEAREYVTVNYIDGTNRKMFFNGNRPSGYRDVVEAFYEIDPSPITLGA